MVLLDTVWTHTNMGHVGLFLGSGRSLASAGPGGAVVAYILMGTGEQLLLGPRLGVSEAALKFQPSHLVGHQLSRRDDSIDARQRPSHGVPASVR